MGRPTALEARHDAADAATEHAALDRRVRELDRRAFLTPAEQSELTDLKKLKLAAKDRLRAS